MTQSGKPPTPRRCRRILQAHCLRCRGLTIRQIAAQLGCARSTVFAYLRDFRLHRQHILESFTADQLADQLHQLVQPGQEPQQHQQHIAALRELRLILTAWPKIHAARQPTETAAPQINLGSKSGPNHDERDQRYLPWTDLQPSGQTEPDPDQAAQTGSESSLVQTNLDKSGPPQPEFPVPGNESAPPARNSRPQPRIGPQYPVSWDNPIGYSLPSPEPLLKRLFAPP